MPIRWRLTLWFALVLCIILILSGVVLHILLQRYLINQIDEDLKVYSARIHGTLNPQEVPEPVDYDVIHAGLPPINEFSSPGIYIQLIDQSGNVTVKSDNLGEQELPVNPALIEEGFAGDAVIRTLAAGDSSSIRIMVSPLFLPDQTLLLEIAQSLNHVNATMSQVRWAILASIIVALVLATIVGGVIVRSALSPVSRIIQTARAIEAGSDLNRRVSYSGPMDEIGQLAETFDRMIEDLDKVFQSQKHFVADASHELRGPLTVIRGNLDLLKRSISQEDRRESLKAIEAETTMMSRITNDLLALAELESVHSVKPTVVSLKSVVLEEMKRAQHIAGNRKIIVEQPEDLKVKGDTDRLKQLLGNLVDNAIRYTPEEGTITLSLFRNGDWACLKVADTGVGIPAEHQRHIFDRFYRTDKARSRVSGGTGLGLAIVRSIAEQHGGKVTVASEPGKGSIFTVWLKL